MLLMVFLMYATLFQQSHAQVTSAKVANSVKPTPLSIGDKIPDELWNLPLQVVNHPQGKQIITLADYKDKLIILDFWATWCPPCISSLYKLDTIQKDFKDDFIVIPITNENSVKAEKYFKSRQWSLPTVVNDKNLQEYFPHKYIPHYIWINKIGKISAITGCEPVNRKNIQVKITGNEVKMPYKNDLMTFDPQKPLFMDGNGGDGSSIKYRSLFSDPISGLGQITSSVIADKEKETSRIYCVNCQLLMLYTLAFSKIETFPQNRIVLDVKDPSKLQTLGNENSQEDWLKNNTYCYELITPLSSQNKVREQMAEDLNRFFGLNARFEKRITECYVLTALPSIEKSYSKGGKREDNLFDKDSTQKYIKSNTMDALYGYLNEVLPLNVVDETNCLNTLDLQFSEPEKENIKPFQDALRKQGISLEKSRREVEFFIISDN